MKTKISHIKIIFLCILSYFFLKNTDLYSQIPQSEDSLKIFLKNHPKDTLYVWALRPYALIQIYEKGDQTKGDSIANVLKTLSEKLNYGRGIYFSYLIKGIVNQQRSQYNEMLINFKKCNEIVNKYKLNKYLQEASLSNIAQAFNSLGNKDSVMQYALLAIEVQEKANLPKMDTSPYEAVGNVLKFYGKYKDALQYYQKGLTICTKRMDYNGMAILENKIGNLYDDWKKNDEATKHYKTGLNYAEKSKYLLLQTDLLSNLGRMATDANQLELAEKYLKQNEKICKSLESRVALKTVYIGLGNLYLKQKKFQLAEKYLLSADSLTSDSEGNPRETQIMKETLADFYAEVKNYSKAFQLQKEANIARDSAYKIASDKLSQELLLKYETEKKEQQIKILDQETKNKQIKITYLIITSLLVALLAMITIAWLINVSRYKQLTAAQKLRNRIASDLHDEIGSTLSSISILSEIVAFQQKNQEYKPEIMMQVSEDAREVIEKMDDIIWTLNPENDAFYNLETRIKTFSIPLFESKNINFSIKFSSELESIKIDMGKRREIYLIAKEATNNLIKYSKCQNARIEGYVAEKSLKIIIADDGIGFDTMQGSQRNGLKNMKARADKIGADFQINSQPNEGTSITLTVKL